MGITYDIDNNNILNAHWEDDDECYNDANLGLIEAYEHAKKNLPLPNINFSSLPIDVYQKEIDRVFHLLATLN